MKFKELLQVKYQHLKHVPAGYKRLGNYMFLRSQEELTSALGMAILETYSWVEGVFQYIKTTGVSRNPRIRHLAGSKNTIVKHKENKVTYILDFSKIMFSGGNSSLRKQLVNIVKRNEVLVDMFAAVGNLSLQVLYYRKLKGILIEQNPYTFSFLTKTIEFNKINNVELINNDCRNVYLSNIADRIFMGYHDVNLSHITKALDIAKKICVIHLHPIAKEDYYEEWEIIYQNWMKGLNAKIINISTHKVKNYSPGLHHIEIVIKIDKD